jgi:LysM repeat protein
MNQKIVLFIIVAAAIVAIGGFLLVSFLFSGSNGDLPPTEVPSEGGVSLPGETTLIVGNESITVRYDPNKQVVLVESELPPTEGTDPTPELPPTETPAPEGPTDTPSAPDNGTEPTAPPVTVTARPPKVVKVPYTVKQGDTFYSIATFHNNNKQPTSVVLIGKHVSADELVPGNQIQVPVGNPAYCPTPYHPYVVLEGENAFRIAQKRNTTVEHLRQINGLDANYTVYLSDVICVP